MGQVYRAVDTRLGRNVAIKVCAQRFSERFEREARAIAALNHLNVCTLHDVGPDFLVMELVEGPTLEQRVAKGPIPLEESLQIARQIADALEAAHEKGIVHRDLKPGNVKLKADGTVKVLDFGLAKVDGTPAAQSENSATLTMEATEPGAILGTTAYMSPEQAKGMPVDKRTDIWAFGVVWYEMLAGRKPFSGATATEVLAAVIEREPDWGRVPAKIRPLLQRCLTKDPKRRLRDIGDAMPLVDLAPEAQPAAPPAQRRKWLGPAVAALLLVTLAPVAILHFRERPAETPMVRFTIPPPENTRYGWFPVPSPDGRRLVFPAQKADGPWHLWVRPLDTTTPQELAETEFQSLPFWSADGRSIGFLAGGKLKRIELSGGPPIALADAPGFRGASWSPLGTILFAPARTGPLFRIEAAGGNPAPATVLDPGRKEGSHRWPWFLPDGRHFIYSAVSTDGAVVTSLSTIYAGSLDSRESRIVAQASSNAVYASGYLLFLREHTLMAQPFDGKRLTTTGEAVPIATPVQDSPAAGLGLFAASNDGTLVFQPGSQPLQRLAWLDRTGASVAALGEPGPLLISPVLSPDGKRAMVSAFDPAAHNNDLWIFDLTRNLRNRFTFSSANENAGVWSPDGSTIVFNSSGKGHLDLYRKLASGAGAEELLYANEMNKTPASWSPDGKFILYTSTADQKTYDLWILPLAGEAKPFPFRKTAFNERDGRFSPDGRWVAYQSEESGRSEIYVASFPDSGTRTQVSLAGGVMPRWLSDGKEISYAAPDRRLIVTEIGVKGREVVIGASRPLSPNGNQPAVPFLFDVSSDGQHFLAVMPEQAAPPDPLTLVLNWTGGVRK
jgi:Tol biopolymer transport system component/predicted Ser/Thr protein kinase